MLEKKRLCILVPIYDDWQSLEHMIDEFYKHLHGAFQSIKVVAINDGSRHTPQNVSARKIEFEIVHLRRNLGHQKAIAIGISHLAHEKNYDLVVVMDGDGEDKPEDIRLLAEAHSQFPENIIFAKRKKRKKGAPFIFLYWVYKFLFRIFTGKFISFGNFCLIPGDKIISIAHLSEIWNHFSGGIIRSRMPYSTVLISRGERTSGKSRMNLVSLVIHGISSISVYLDVVSVRLLIFFGVLILISFVGILVVVSLRLYTALAIPGWASTIGIGLILIILQSFFVLLILSFMILSYRSQILFTPALHYRDFILKVQKNE